MKKIASIMLSVILGLSICLNSYASTYKIPLSSRVQCIAWEMQCEYKISAPLLMALVYEESKGNEKAKNGVHKGLTQINPRYFKKTIKELEVTDLYDPYQNMKVCAYTLRTWFEKYGDSDIYLIIEMWNKGEENALSQHKEDKPTRYARRIVERAEEWTIYYEEEMNAVRPIY